MPVRLLNTRAWEKSSTKPVSDIVTPTSARDKTITRLGPYFAESKPPRTAKITYPRKFPEAIRPV
jgi:hypothetical protein